MSLKAQVTSGLFWSGVGRMAQQAIQFGLSVVLARLLSPADYGLLAMAMVFTGFAAMLADAGFSSALVQKQDIKEDHVHTVFWVTLASGVLLAVITCIAAPLLAEFYRTPALTRIVQAIALNFIIGAVGNVPLALLQKQMRFQTIVKIDTAAMLLSGLVGVGLAWRGAEVWSLVAQSLLASLTASMLRCRACRWIPKSIFRPAALKDIWRFTSHLYGFNLVNYWARNTDNMVVGKYFGAPSLGAYSRAYALMLMPITQINSVISQVMFPALSGIQDDKERIRRIYLRSVGHVTLLAFPMMLGLSVVAEQFVLTVYGAKWIEITPILQILSLVGVMQALVGTTGLLLLSQGRSDKLFYWWTLFSLLGIASFFVGVAMGSVWALAICYAVANLIYSYPALSVAGRVVNLAARDILTAVAGPFMCSLAMASVVYVVHYLMPVSWPSWLSLMFLVAVGVATYAAGVIAFKLSAWMDLQFIIFGEIKR